jgi:site-specific recombinase XerD
LLQPTGPPSRFCRFFAQQANRRLSVFVELNRCAVVGRRASTAAFAKHFDRCPEQLGSEDIRSYQLHLIHKKASWSRFNQVVCALGCLYATTLCLSEQMPRIPYGKKPKSLPCVLSTEEVASLLTAAPARAAPAPSSTRGIVKIHPLDLQKRQSLANASVNRALAIAEHL